MAMEIPPALARVLELLTREGVESWLVGGAVRDGLLGRAPKDWDLAAKAEPLVLARLLRNSPGLAKAGVRYVPRSAGVREPRPGGDPGMVTSPAGLLLGRGWRGEISPFRGETLAEDLARRDFTVNAMAWHPDRSLADPLGGKGDLEQKLLRSPGDPRAIIAADALRSLRAARLALELGFTIEKGTWEAITELSGHLAAISPERIREEFSSILIGPRPRAGLDLLLAGNLLGQIIPELLPCVGLDQQNPHHHQDVYGHIAATVENTPPDLVLRLAALCHDLAKPLAMTVDEKGVGHFYGHEKIGAALAAKILGRLRYDSRTIAGVKNLVAAHMLRLSYPKLNPAKLLARVGRENVGRLFALQRADALAGEGRGLGAIAEMEEKVARALAEQRPFAREDLAVSGRDLLALGVPPGRTIGRVLNDLLAAVQEDPGLNARSLLLELAREHLETESK